MFRLSGHKAGISYVSKSTLPARRPLRLHHGFHPARHVPGLSLYLGTGFKREQFFLFSERYEYPDCQSGTPERDYPRMAYQNGRRRKIPDPHHGQRYSFSVQRAGKRRRKTTLSGSMGCLGKHSENRLLRLLFRYLPHGISVLSEEKREEQLLRLRRRGREKQRLFKCHDPLAPRCAQRPDQTAAAFVFRAGYPRRGCPFLFCLAFYEADLTTAGRKSEKTDTVHRLRLP